MAKSYIDAEKLIAEIESRMEDCKLPNGRFPTTTNAVRYEELSCLRNFIASLHQEQPETKEQISHLEHWLAFFGCPEENIEKCATQIAQGYGAIRYLEGIRHGAEAVNELAQQEQPEANLEKAARCVYESWMGGTMDDVRRYMVELGKVLNARKEE